MKKNNKTRCEKCGSTLVYRRIKTNELVCRQCGYIKDLSKKEVKGGKKND